MPFFVEREFITQHQEDYKKEIVSSLSQIESLLRKKMPSKQVAKVERIKQELQEVDIVLNRYVSDEFNKWLKQIKAHKYGIRPDYGKRVAEAYFNGFPPFESKKAREDIPDSFIGETIVDIIKTVGKLKIITADEKELSWKEVTGEVIPEDNQEARIMGFDSLEDISIDKEEVEYYGDGEFTIPFHTAVEARLNYAIYISDYYCLPEEKAKNISKSELNDHYYDAEEKIIF
jgi:hypothetical protein